MDSERSATSPAAARNSGRAIKDFTRRFPGVMKGIAELPSDTVIDGEVVALDENGKPSFNLLQGLGSAQAIILYAFDLLMLQGKDVRLWPFDDRREQLREIVSTLRTRSAIRKPSTCGLQNWCGP
jgi:ATP-dependent DNA ligase